MPRRRSRRWFRRGWQRAREELLIAEKAQTRARDAVAAQRRRMPMTEVEATLEANGSDGPRPCSTCSKDAAS